MAIYLKWHMCSCHEPLVALISICSDTFGRVEYIDRFASITHPLNSLLVADTTFTWNEGANVAFKELKNLLASYP